MRLHWSDEKCVARGCSQPALSGKPALCRDHKYALGGKRRKK